MHFGKYESSKLYTHRQKSPVFMDILFSQEVLPIVITMKIGHRVTQFFLKIVVFSAESSLFIFGLILISVISLINIFIFSIKLFYFPYGRIMNNLGSFLFLKVYLDLK